MTEVLCGLCSTKMVAVQLLVSMVRQDPGQDPHSTDILAIDTEDMVTLRQLQAQVCSLNSLTLLTTLRLVS